MFARQNRDLISRMNGLALAESRERALNENSEISENSDSNAQVLSPPIIAVCSLLASVPCFPERFEWISKLAISLFPKSSGLSAKDISKLDTSVSSDFGKIDVGIDGLPRIIKPKEQCGLCGSCNGEFCPLNTDPSENKFRVRLFGMDGLQYAENFIFKCGECSAKSGVVCCEVGDKSDVVWRLRQDRGTLFDVRGNEEAGVFILPRQRTGRKDQMVAFSLKLLENYTWDAVTFKSFEAFVTTYNYTHNLIGTNKALNVDAFRNSWFLYNACICSHEMPISRQGAHLRKAFRGVCK